MDSHTQATQTIIDNTTQGTQTEVTTTCTQTEETTTEKTSTSTQTTEVTHLTPETFSTDPRCYFAGAPSRYMEGRTASNLRDIRRSIQRESYRRRWVPEGLLCIQRIETAMTADGTFYRLEDVWVRNARSETRDYRTVETQTRREEEHMYQEEPLDLSVRE